MKVYWEYMCDYNHSWGFFREENAKEELTDVLCPSGHEAVTLHKFKPVDEIQITIQPAGRIVDSVKNQVALEKRYWFVITDRIQGDEERKSKNFYSWDEIRKFSERFHGLTKENAWRLWDKLGL